MRLSKAIAFSDIGGLGFAAFVLVRPSILSIAYGLTAFVLMWAVGMYRPRISYRLRTQLPPLLCVSVLAALIIGAVPGVDRMALMLQVPLSVLTILATRLVTISFLRWRWSQSRHCDAALVIGTDRQACIVAGALLGNAACGVRPVGLIGSPEMCPESPVPVVADMAQLDQTIERLDVRHVIVADASNRQGAITTRMWYSEARDIDVWVVPAGRESHDLDAIQFRHVRRPWKRAAAHSLKRAFDIVVAGAMVLVTAPSFVLVALAVRLTSPGPIFFRQQRIGQHGRVFKLLKFRTMRVNEDSDTRWSVTNKQHVTPIGYFLRRSCIDELPQLLNVLRGDMSLVGPRPERPYFAEHFSLTVPEYSHRLRVPVGITGWSQIHGLRGDTSIAERTRYDNYYIDHWSLRFDIMIMFRTVVAVVQWLVRSEEPAAETSEIPADGVSLLP
jgi:exopolysaccharide biosynthesis polyprenyl glycosylphosphotransferase